MKAYIGNTELDTRKLTWDDFGNPKLLIVDDGKPWDLSFDLGEAMRGSIANLLDMFGCDLS